jgi:hypothetical protein
MTVLGAAFSSAPPASKDSANAFSRQQPYYRMAWRFSKRNIASGVVPDVKGAL